MTLTKTQQFKNWTKSHKDEIGFAIGTTAFFAIVITAGFFAYKQDLADVAAYNETIAKFTEWANAERALGKVVVQLATGGYISVAPETLISNVI